MSTSFHIQLLLFTALSPAGAVAFIIASVRVITASRGASWFFCLQRMLLIPLALCMLGLVIAATHLGTPRNALYVLLGVGRSPLSNEMAATLIFLALAWLFWLSLATHRLPVRAGKLWLGVTCAAALAMIYAVSVAYSIDTVPVWSLPVSPALCWFAALTLGAPLALFTMQLARADLPHGARRVIVTLMGVGIIGELGAMAILHGNLTSVTSALTDAASLVPAFGWYLAAFALLATSGAVVAGRATNRELAQRQKLIQLGSAVLLAALAVICVRIPFYLLSMTVGL